MASNATIHWDPTEDQKAQGDGEWERLATDGPVIIRKKPCCKRWLIQVEDRKGVIIAEALAYSSGSIGEVARQFKNIAGVV